MKGKKTPIELVTKVVSLRQSGKTRKEIAQDTGLSENTIQGIIQQHNAQMNDGIEPILSEILAKLDLIIKKLDS